MELHAEHPTNPYPTCMHLFNASFFFDVAVQLICSCTNSRNRYQRKRWKSDSDHCRRFHNQMNEKKEQQTNNGDVEAGKEIMNDRFE